MVVETMATAAGAAVIMYLILSKRLARKDEDKGGDSSRSSVSVRRRRLARRPAQPPANLLESIVTFSKTLRFTYSKTLGKWPIGDLVFGINYFMGKQLNGSSVIQPGQKHMSLQLQQRREIPLDDCYKAFVGSSTNVKPLLSSVGQYSVVTAANTSSTNKLHSTVNASSMLSSSPGFVRPSCGATSTRFGSALSIETLVTTVEKRETPIEDYAMESDETHILNAAHLMVTSMAGSLVHVTCKSLINDFVEVAGCIGTSGEPTSVKATPAKRPHEVHSDTWSLGPNGGVLK